MKLLKFNEYLEKISTHTGKPREKIFSRHTLKVKMHDPNSLHTFKLNHYITLTHYITNQPNCKQHIGIPFPTGQKLFNVCYRKLQLRARR